MIDAAIHVIKVVVVLFGLTFGFWISVAVFCKIGQLILNIFGLNIQ